MKRVAGRCCIAIDGGRLKTEAIVCVEMAKPSAEHGDATLGIAAVRELSVMQTIRITNVPVLFTCSTELRQALIVAMLLLGAVFKIMCLVNLFKKAKNKISHTQPYKKVYILEHEIKIPLVWRDEMGRETNYSYSYGYEKGWLKLCLWGGTAYKKMVDEQEVEKIIAPIRDLQLKEYQVHDYLQKLGGFEYWNYYNEYFKSELVYA